MKKIVLSAPYSPLSYCWNKLKEKYAAKDLSIAEVINLYHGFEGELIEILPLPENAIEQIELFEKLKLSIGDGNTNMLLVLDPADSVPDSLKNDASFVGYDVGMCDEDNGFYSSIFNEILFGAIYKLASYKARLNRDLLFDGLDVAKEYIKLHRALGNQGEDVESYYPMSVYAIWKLE